MKNDIRVLMRLFWVVFSVLIGTSAFGQGRITHQTEILEKTAGPSMGRDLWFTMARNYESQGGKYYELYVTSPNATTVNIQVTGGTASKRTIKPLEVWAFRIPLGWEVTTSGIVEDLAIRVWSNDADLTAYLLSRNPYTSDGMYIIPTIGWGTEYVVAGYHSLYEGFSSFSFDYPTEFCIVANQDNTICTIIPSGDIRKTGLPNDVLHKKGEPFTETLNKGQCVQYMWTMAQNADDYDVTGSLVRSTRPVGIVGASQCPNIPPEYPYCDHICDMIPPVRTWAKTYYTLPFYNRKGGDSFVMIASQDGQTIYFNGVPVTTLKKFEHIFRPDIADAGTWTSNAPFLLAQYINSTEWPDPVTGQNNNGIGDPAMVVINAREQYTKEVVFQTPTITTGTGYTHYANILVHKDEVLNTTMDGIIISSYPSISPLPIPFSDYIAYRARSLKSGTHRVKSGQGVGVYVYGYGSYDSYAWAGALGTRTFNDPDTIAPVVIPAGVCFDAHVDLRDNHTSPPAAKILDILLDSVYNMKFIPDPNFVSGSFKEISFYDMSVIDQSREAYLRVTTIDGAGNRSTVTSTYRPMTAVIDPPLYNFGRGVSGTRITTYLTITNTGAVPYDVKDISLAFGDRGFQIDSGITGPIPVGETRIIKVSFEPPNVNTFVDTVIVVDGCNRLTAELLGNGGVPDFRVSGYKITDCELIGNTYNRNRVIIANVSDQPLTIVDIWVDDPVHFGYDKNNPVSNRLPFDIQPGENKTIETTFMPDIVGNYTTTIHVKSSNAGERTAQLHECGIAPGAKTTKNEVQTSECDRNLFFTFTTTDTGSAPITVDRFVTVGDPSFSQPVQYTNVGGTPITLPFTLQPGELINARIDFTPPPQASGVYTAQVFAISSTGDTTNSVTATVNSFYREAQVTKGTITMAPVLYGSPRMTDTYTICNQRPDSLKITGVNESPGPYNNANINSFNTIGYSMGGNPVTLPVTLAQGQCLDITVEFDPTQSTDLIQTSLFFAETDACAQPPALQIQAGTRVGPLTIGNNSTPTILSCNNASGQVPITNPNPGNVTVQSVTITGVNQANFAIVQPTPVTIASATTEYVNYTFTPTPGQGLQNYTANIEVVARRPDGTDTTLTGVIDGSASSMTAQVSSIFATVDQNVRAGVAVRLPIALAVNKNGLGVPLTDLDVRRIELVYTYNSDILDIANDNPEASFQRAGLPAGWDIDQATTLVEGTGGNAGTLTLVLTGTNPLPDNVTSLGEMPFTAALSRYGQSTDVTLQSARFFRADGSEIQGCFVATTQGTSTNLVYECGDRTLIAALNGQMPAIIAPVTPNPVRHRGDLITLKYAIRYMSPLKLMIYDELGKEVRRLVDARQHPAGAYEVRFDASELASGTYTYRLEMDGATRSGRFVVNY